jgi:hypothetical protein
MMLVNNGKIRTGKSARPERYVVNVAPRTTSGYWPSWLRKSSPVPDRAGSFPQKSRFNRAREFSAAG